MFYSSPKNSPTHQLAHGFTLIEIAIVMVVIGVLLGGVLKGSEVITSAKLKRVVSDVQGVRVAIYSYQDRYRALPGDDPRASAHFASASNGDGDRQIDGNFYSKTATDETQLLWQHLRAAGLIEGDSTSGAQPSNAFGGILGVESDRLGMTGVVICNSQIKRDHAATLDAQNDDGNPATGQVRAALKHTNTTAVADYSADGEYTLCFGL